MSNKKKRNGRMSKKDSRGMTPAELDKMIANYSNSSPGDNTLSR